MHSWHASGQLVGTLSWRQVHGETPPLTVRQLELDPSPSANRLQSLVYKTKKNYFQWDWMSQSVRGGVAHVRTHCLSRLRRVHDREI